MRLRVAMVGLGVISRYYAAALERSREMQLLAVYDTDPDRCEPYRAAAISVAATLDELLCRRDLDAVLVNVPNHLHRDVCCAALEHDLHVCCEKPLATELIDAEAMVQTARRRGRVLFTALHRRYNSPFARLSTAVRGRAVDARARYLEDIRAHCGDDLWYLDPRRCGGGCLADNGPNALDLLLELLGPLSIARAELTVDDRGVDLQARMELSASGGRAASLELDWTFSQGEVKDVTVDCSDHSRSYCDLLAGYEAFKSSLYHEYTRVLDDFARAVRLGEQRGERGLELVRLVQDAYRMATITSLAR